MFDCPSCVVAERLETLSPENCAAWDLFQRAHTRFLTATQSVGAYLARVTADLPADDYDDLMTRLGILYDVYCPRKAQKTPDA